MSRQEHPAAEPQNLSREFYDRDPVVVAKELLGKHLVYVSDGADRADRGSRSISRSPRSGGPLVSRK